MPNLLANGGFEQDFTGWTVMLDCDTQGAQVTSIQGQVYEGGKAAALSARNFGGVAVCSHISQIVPGSLFVSGRKYRFRGKIRTDNLAAGRTVSVVVAGIGVAAGTANSEGAFVDIPGISFVASGADVSVDLVVSPGIVGGTTTTHYIDALVLEEQPDPASADVQGRGPASTSESRGPVVTGLEDRDPEATFTGRGPSATLAPKA